MIKYLTQTLFNLLQKNMKVGASYNLFDGEELLEASIKSIRDNVHHISVVYQTVSNLGNPASLDIKEKLEKLKKEGLIDEIHLYAPNLKLAPYKNEIKKRNIGLKLAKTNGCNYFISMDADEFYDKEQFKNALNLIIKGNVKTSAVSIIEYLKAPQYQILGDYTYKPDRNKLYNFYVPFVVKIEKFGLQRYKKGYFPCLVDPTRKLTHPGRFKLFSLQEIAMHHMSTVRYDLNKKYENSSALGVEKENQEHLNSIQQEVLAFDFEKSKTLPPNCAIFRNNIVRKVENKFDINL